MAEVSITAGKIIGKARTSYPAHKFSDTEFDTSKDSNEKGGHGRNIVKGKKLMVASVKMEDLGTLASKHNQGAAVRPFLDQINTRRSVMTP